MASELREIVRNILATGYTQTTLAAQCHTNQQTISDMKRADPESTWEKHWQLFMCLYPIARGLNLIEGRGEGSHKGQIVTYIKENVEQARTSLSEEEYQTYREEMARAIQRAADEAGILLPARYGPEVTSHRATGKNTAGSAVHAKASPANPARKLKAASQHKSGAGKVRPTAKQIRAVTQKKQSSKNS